MSVSDSTVIERAATSTALERRRPISSTPVRSVDPDQLVETVVHSLDDDKAEEVTVIDLRGRSSIADHMVIATGRSQRQVGAMAEHLHEKLRHFGLPVSIEGMTQGDWVLIDAGDIVVHLFRPEVRSFYNLERMWGGAAASKVAERADALIA